MVATANKPHHYARQAREVGKLNIASAIKKPGALHKEMGIAQGKKIPQAKLAKAAKAGGKLGQRARFAETLEHMNKGK